MAKHANSVRTWWCSVVVSTRMVARAELFAGIGIELTPHPFVAFIESDDFGTTVVPGIWAACNASDLVMEDLVCVVAALPDAQTDEGAR